MALFEVNLHLSSEDRKLLTDLLKAFQSSNQLMRIKLMPVIAEIRAMQAKALEAIRADTDRDSATRLALKANTDTIKALQDQLTAAGTDPARLEEVRTTMQEILNAQDANAVAEAIVENTDDEFEGSGNGT